MSPTFIGSRFGVDTRIGSDDGSPPRSRAGVRFGIYLLDRGAAVSMATTVYFDLDGTLLDYEVPFQERFTRTVPVDPTDEMVETYSDRVLEGITQIKSDPFERAFSAVCERYSLDADPETLAAEFVDREVGATRLDPAVRRLVESLAKRHQFGVLTNGDGYMQRRKLEEHGLDDLADAVVISNEVGVRKPNPQIFETAKERLPAESYLYVGDTFEEDIAPAREAGFETVYIGDDRPDAPVSARRTAALASLLLPLVGEATEN